MTFTFHWIDDICRMLSADGVGNRCAFWCPSHSPPACCSASVIQKSACIHIHIYIYIYIYSVVFLFTEMIGVWFDSAGRSRMSQGKLLYHQMQAINQWTLMPYFKLCSVSSPLHHVQSNSVITLWKGMIFYVFTNECHYIRGLWLVWFTETY